MAELSESSLSDFKLEKVSGTRCRMQRHSDLKFFAGWITATKEDTLAIELKDAQAVVPGDKFHLEAAVETANVRFGVSALRQEGNTVWLKMDSKPQMSSPGQEARYRVEDIHVSVHGLELPVDGDAVDISMSGLGILSFESMPRFAKVRMVVRGSVAAIECCGTVCYCRPNADIKGTYRIGLQVEFEDRLARAMWHRLVMSAAATEEKAA